MKKQIKSSHQKRLASSVAFATLCGREYAYVETGRLKPFSEATVRSLLATGEVEAYPHQVPSVTGLHYLIPSGGMATLVSEIDGEWQYGECMSYLDEKGIPYDSNPSLIALRSLVLDDKMGFTN